MWSSSSLSRVAFLCSWALLAGCGVAVSPQPSTPAEPPAPAWTGSLLTEFDDTIDHQVLTSGSATRPDGDRWFAPRAQSADVVARVRVISTTTQGVGPVQGYRLTLRVVGKPLAGSVREGDTIEVAIPHDSNVFPAARMHDIALTGRTFTGFFKNFAAPAAQVHWYLAGDTQEVAAAAQRARTLSDVGYRVATPRM